VTLSTAKSCWYVASMSWCKIVPGCQGLRRAKEVELLTQHSPFKWISAGPVFRNNHLTNFLFFVMYADFISYNDFITRLTDSRVIILTLISI
jgi:hypothetical protein